MGFFAKFNLKAVNEAHKDISCFKLVSLMILNCNESAKDPDSAIDIRTVIEKSLHASLTLKSTFLHPSVILPGLEKINLPPMASNLLINLTHQLGPQPPMKVLWANLLNLHDAQIKLIAHAVQAGYTNEMADDLEPYLTRWSSLVDGASNEINQRIQTKKERIDDDSKRSAEHQAQYNDQPKSSDNKMMASIVVSSLRLDPQYGYIAANYGYLANNQFHPLIEFKSTQPTFSERKITTHFTGQISITIEVAYKLADHIERLGKFKITGITSLPEGEPQILIRMSASNNQLQLSAKSLHRYEELNIQKVGT